MINHKGSTGQIKIDEEANILFGQMFNIFDIFDIFDILTFKGETIAESK